MTEPSGGIAAQAAAPVGVARPTQPRALIVTIYGLYARESGGWLSVAALIRLMAGLGVDEPAVRSAISRLKQRGMLAPRRQTGAAGYGLSDLGATILAEGDRRIFDRPRPATADGWLLAVFSVPENERSRRHTLRSRLAWLGFGTVSAGVWIAPGQLAAETRDVLASHGLSAYVSLFRADYLAFGDIRDQVGRWWDLNRLEQHYQAFIDSARPLLSRWTRPEASAGAETAKTTEAGGETEAGGAAEAGGETEAGGAAEASGEATAGRAAMAGGEAEAGGAGEAFADYVRVLTAWRRLPFLDPGLPVELLPADWHGARAAELFDALKARLAGPAHAHVLAVTDRAPIMITDDRP